jgi:predicted dehydrogenase
MDTRPSSDPSAPRRQPLNIGVIGCGAVTDQYYLPALKVLEQEGLARPSALFDPDAEGLSRAGLAFPRAKRATSLEAFLQCPAELVIVASPPTFHAKQTIAALQSGRAVLCEKPMAITAADCEAMVKAAQEAGQLLCVGLMRRAFPATQTIRNILQGGMLGPLRLFRCFEGGPFRWPVRSASYFDKRTSGGGVLIDIGPHVLDLLGWWLGPPKEISYQDDAMGGVEASCRIHLAYDGFAGEVRLSRDWHRPNRYHFEGMRGWLGWTVNDADQIEWGFPETSYAAAAQLRDVGSIDGLPGQGRAAPNFLQSFLAHLRGVVAAARGEIAPMVSGAEALESMRLIEHCYRIRTLLPMPWLHEQARRAL